MATKKLGWPALGLCLLALSMPVRPHEFWLAAQPDAPSAGGPVEVSLHVGEYFEGGLVAVTSSHAASVRLHSKGGVEDLTARIPGGTALRGLTLSLPRPGSYLLAYESHPSQVVLSADKFHAYLHDEGLDAIIGQREASGTAGSPARERFRRSAKLLLGAGGRTDATFSRVTGQRMEIIPVNDPLAAAPGDPLRFVLRFDGKPLAGALLKAWHRRGGQTLVIRSVTDADGQAMLELPFAGPWLLGAVHMRPVSDSPDLDWDSFWGSLSFSMAPKKAR